MSRFDVDPPIMRISWSLLMVEPQFVRQTARLQQAVNLLQNDEAALNILYTNEVRCHCIQLP